MESPKDHTSDETVYVPRLFCDSPRIRSGCIAVNLDLNKQNAGHLWVTYSHVALTPNIRLR